MRRAFPLLGTVQATLIFTITVLSVPLPTIAARFHLAAPDLVLLSAAYGLPFSGLLLLGGRLTDRYGGRRVLAAGLALFAAASLATALAPSYPALTAARFAQGTAAAAIAPAALATLRTALASPARYARATPLWGTLSVTGATAGIVLSGLVLALPAAHLSGGSGTAVGWPSWRWLFAIPVLVATAALALARRTLPATPPNPAAALDLPGALLATTGITALSYGLIASGAHPWLSLPVAAPLLAGAALLAAFVAAERRHPDPLLPPAFLAHRRRLTGLAVTALAAASTTVTCLFLPLYGQRVLGWTPLDTSLAFVPYAAVLLAVGRGAGRMIRRLGERRVAATGLVALAVGLGTLSAGLLHMSTLDNHAGTAAGLPAAMAVGMTLGLVVLAAGAAMAFAAGAVLVVGGVPAGRTGLAGGVLNTAMELGPTVGLALVSTVVASATARLAAGGSPSRAATAGGYGWGFAAAGLAALLVLAAVLTLPPPAANASPATSRGAVAGEDVGASRDGGALEDPLRRGML